MAVADFESAATGSGVLPFPVGVDGERRPLSGHVLPEIRLCSTELPQAADTADTPDTPDSLHPRGRKHRSPPTADFPSRPAFTRRTASRGVSECGRPRAGFVLLSCIVQTARHLMSLAALTTCLCRSHNQKHTLMLTEQ